MRKRYQRKKTCPMCHPNKTGHAPRWTDKELDRLKAWERERQRWEKYSERDE